MFGVSLEQSLPLCRLWGRLCNMFLWDFSQYDILDSQSSHSHSSCLKSQGVEWGGGAEGGRLMTMRKNESGEGRWSKPGKSCQKQRSNAWLNLECAECHSEFFYRDRVARMLVLWKQPTISAKWESKKRTHVVTEKRQGLLKAQPPPPPASGSFPAFLSWVLWFWRSTLDEWVQLLRGALAGIPEFNTSPLASQTTSLWQPWLGLAT